MKKPLVSLLLVINLLIVLTACGRNNDTEEIPDNNSSNSVISSENSSDTAEEITFTYSYSDAASRTWSPTDWETNDEGAVLSYISMGLYDFWIDSDGTGYQIVPEMADQMPVDVTREFAGNQVYGVPEDAISGYAWRISLNPEACWEDGSPITSADYIYSMQQFLNPEMANFRASNYYSGQLTLANAYDYYKGDQDTKWHQVGLIADDEYTITLVLAAPISEFYLAYNLSSSWLVHEDTYEAGKIATGDLIKSSYGTSVNTTMSHGPYRLTEFQADKYMKLTRNENWYGYQDGKHDEQYQTTDIYIQYIDEHTTEMSLFLQGRLSTVNLDATDIETYGNSDYLYYEPQTHTSKFSFNGDYETLSRNDGNGINHSILSIKDFRKAISLCLDRNAFCASCTAGHEAGYGLLNYNYTAVPETGELYRDFEAAQEALCEVYDADDVSDITGYDREEAAELFQEAYEEAINSGIMKPEDRVELNFHLYGTDESYVRIVNFLQESIDAATIGTSLENKITINLVGDENYYDNMETGAVDIAITTWGGASMDPYSIMECYCDPGTKHEYSFDPTTEQCTIEVNDQEITKTFYEWYLALCDGEYKTADYDTKIQVLAGMEEGLLETYLMVPVYYRNAASLYAHRIKLGSETYLNSLLEFGGIRYMTYTMNDREWAQYCAENNHQLKY